MPTIPQKQLRNEIGEILRRAEAGEVFTITVSGRPVAQLGPIERRRWVPSEQLGVLSTMPVDPTLARDIEDFDFDIGNPWED
jgi:prevent-host-death family protein